MVGTYISLNIGTITSTKDLIDMAITEELLQVLHQSDDGVADSEIKKYFGERYTELVPVINELLGSNRIQLFLQGDVIFYRFICFAYLIIIIYTDDLKINRAIEEGIASRLEGLG